VLILETDGALYSCIVLNSRLPSRISSAYIRTCIIYFFLKVQNTSDCFFFRQPYMDRLCAAVRSRQGWCTGTGRTPSYSCPFTIRGLVHSGSSRSLLSDAYARGNGYPDPHTKDDGLCDEFSPVCIDIRALSREDRLSPIHRAT
jgi:hypothetical protein